MKPTSYIFLVLSAILLFGGIVTCSLAQSMADSENTQIFEQSIDENGDSVYVYNLTDEKLSKLELKFSNVDVKIIGSAEASYVELKNFSPYSYSTSLAGSTVSVDGTVSGISSFIDLSGGGLKFKGLRYLFADKPASDRQKSVNIYISDACDIKSLSLNIQKGSVTFENIANSVDYNVNAKNAEVKFNNVSTKSVINLNISSGKVDVENTECVSLNVDITDAELNVNMSNISAECIYYEVKSTESAVSLNGIADEDGEFKIAVSPDIQKCMVKIEATNSKIELVDTVIKTA